MNEVEKMLQQETLRVKIPGGYLVAEPCGDLDSYPGILIRRESNETPGIIGEVVACVEYLHDDEALTTEAYCRDREEPICKVNYETGEDSMYY